MASAAALGAPSNAAADDGRAWVAAQLAPPGEIPDVDEPDSADASNFVVRLNRLEAELRHARGEIEQLQNRNQRLEDELRRFRDDVEFRLSGTRPPAAPPVETPKLKGGDAFDPAANPTALGAPRPLGSTPPSAPLSNGLEFKRPAGAPLDIGAHPPPTASVPLPAPSGPMIQGSGLDFADAPRRQYAAAVEAYKAGQYDVAEAGLKAFLGENSGHKLTPDALFLLGESYMQRSRPRDAAEQYLKLSTDFAKSPRAPEGMLRLGQALALLGNGEQACATFAEVGKRYPTASGSVRRSVEREMQKNHC